MDALTAYPALRFASTVSFFKWIKSSSEYARRSSETVAKLRTAAGGAPVYELAGVGRGHLRIEDTGRAATIHASHHREASVVFPRAIKITGRADPNFRDVGYARLDDVIDYIQRIAKRARRAQSLPN